MKLPDYITADVLREAQTLLWDGTNGCQVTYQFICVCVNKVCELQLGLTRRQAHDDMNNWLLHTGMIYSPYKGSNSAVLFFELGTPNSEKQAVRFMLLEFLALAIESGDL